jgi:hypothetical protein
MLWGAEKGGGSVSRLKCQLGESLLPFYSEQPFSPSYITHLLCPLHVNCEWILTHCHLPSVFV